MPIEARLPQLCEYGRRKRYEYLTTKKEIERKINKLLYEDHINSCPICRIAMQAEEDWAKRQREESK